MILEIKNVSCGYGSNVIIKGISATVNSGEILCLLGPNGVGKTTLFKTVLRFLKLIDGEILLDNKDINKIPRKNLATLIGYVPQAHTPPFPFKVIDVVIMGRTAYMGTFGSPSKYDKEIAQNSIDRLGISYLRDKIYTEISGGERQMVLIARALAQSPAFLMMDEPTSNLDFGNQVRVLQCIDNLAKNNNLGIIMTTHFPDHVFQCDGKVALMKKNNKFLIGNSSEIITSQNMKDAYGIDVIVTDNIMNNQTIRSCVPIIKKAKANTAI